MLIVQSPDETAKFCASAKRQIGPDEAREKALRYGKRVGAKTIGRTSQGSRMLARHPNASVSCKNSVPA